MKKTLKRLISVTLICAMIFSVNIRSLAADGKDTEVIDGKGQAVISDGRDCSSQNTNGAIAPDAYDICKGYSYHKMVSCGWGHVYLSDGSCYIRGGAAWQCERCWLVMVTEGDFYYGQMSVIGKWAQENYAYKADGGHVIIEPAIHYGTCNSTTMSGYKFYLDT